MAGNRECSDERVWFDRRVPTDPPDDRPALPCSYSFHIPVNNHYTVASWHEGCGPGTPSSVFWIVRPRPDDKPSRTIAVQPLVQGQQLSLSTSLLLSIC